MPNDMEHERRRFREMDVRKLWTRLSRITDVTKLRNFVRLCDEYASAEYRALRIAAENKLNECLGVTRVQVADPWVEVQCPRCRRYLWRDREMQMYEGRMHCNDCVAQMVKVRRQEMLKEKPEKIRVIRFPKRGGRKCERI